jgi:hypothetical protein
VYLEVHVFLHLFSYSDPQTLTHSRAVMITQVASVAFQAVGGRFYLAAAVWSLRRVASRLRGPTMKLP